MPRQKCNRVNPPNTAMIPWIVWNTRVGRPNMARAFQMKPPVSRLTKKIVWFQAYPAVSHIDTFSLGLVEFVGFELEELSNTPVTFGCVGGVIVALFIGLTSE